MINSILLRQLSNAYTTQQTQGWYNVKINKIVLRCHFSMYFIVKKILSLEV